MNRYFVFLYIEDKRLTRFIDYAIYLLNPTEKWPAHVTLAGPYTNRKEAPPEDELDFCQRLSVMGVSEFRSANQNTVYLIVGNGQLESVWNKPDFAFNPHLTLYDGSDSDLADEIVRWGKAERLIFSFMVSKRVVVSSTKRQGSFNLIERFDPTTLPATKHMNFSEIADQSIEWRLPLAKEALRRAKAYAWKH